MYLELGDEPPKNIRKDFYKEAKPILLDGLGVIKCNNNIYELLERQLKENSGLEKILTQSALFSVMTGLAMEWSRRDTLVQLAVGSMLQKIGITQLRDHSIMLKEEDLIDPGTVQEFQRHPFHAAKIMGEHGDFSEVAKQIVYQRHELFNGKGFPNGISGIKIYPPARMVALCSDFAEILVTMDLDPLGALKQILSTPETASNYDPEFIRGLVETFVKKKKTKKKKNKD